MIQAREGLNVEMKAKIQERNDIRGERREAEQQSLGLSEQPEVVIVGGGQAGLTLAARLRHLEVPTLVLEKWSRPGDLWRRRYKTLCLQQ